jgi:uncharacterized phage protein gp47/JayE
VSFAAEPFGVFVDDLVSALTGGVTREELVFTSEAGRYRLGSGGDFLADTVRVHGLVEGDFFRFRKDLDFGLAADGSISWLQAPAGGPRSGAQWPDLGSHFYLSYERKPEQRAAPVLTDRNPGSVVRTLAESFAREYAVMSNQLDRVYEAGFLETAEGRDLDQVVALVGVERRSRSVAAGEVVFSRPTPAAADIFIPEGTQLSSSQPPTITVETVEARTLRAGTVSVSVPVQALAPGPSGAALAGQIKVIHRPILGIESATNPTAMTFTGDSEADEALRRRARRALETGGRSTVSALIGALLTIEGVREEDIRVAEDHVAFPGTVKVTIASVAELDDVRRRRAAELIDEVRPAGVRVLHNLPVAPPPTLPPAGGEGGAPAGPPLPPVSPLASSETTFALGIKAAVTPASASLTAAQKATLRTRVEEAIVALAGGYGIGEHVVYNQIVGAVMQVEGVNDVSLDLFRVTTPAGPQTGRQNLPPPSPSMKPVLSPTNLSVTLRGALVAMDVTVQVQRLGLAAGGDPEGHLAAIRDEIVTALTAFALTAAGTITPPVLQALLGSPNYAVVRPLRYTAELVDDGLRILREDVPLTLDPEQQLWIRTVSVVEGASTS